MSASGKSNEIDNVYVIDMTGYERIKILFQRINYEELPYNHLLFERFVLNFQFFSTCSISFGRIHSSIVMYFETCYHYDDILVIRMNLYE